MGGKGSNDLSFPRARPTAVWKELNLGVARRRESSAVFSSYDPNRKHRGFWVYIMASAKNGTLYIGVTHDLKKRVAEHKAGVGCGFTAKHGVKTLVYYEHHQYHEAAFRRETELKRWERAWKIRLIEERNPIWEELFIEQY